nr:transposase [Cohnella luojiensis]
MTSSQGQITLRVPAVIYPSREHHAKAVFGLLGFLKGMILGVDDFAIKKGHKYNTGIHNLCGETMPDMLPGRKLDELRAYESQHPDFRQLAPYAVVMDLAPTDRLTAAEGGCPLLRGSGQMISISFCPFG